MTNVEVFVNEQGQPQHLAVLDERKTYELRNGKRDGPTSYRSLCGADTTGQEHKQLPPSDVKVNCDNCNKQLKMWKEVHSEEKEW